MKRQLIGPANGYTLLAALATLGALTYAVVRAGVEGAAVVLVAIVVWVALQEARVWVSRRRKVGGQ